MELRQREEFGKINSAGWKSGGDFIIPAASSAWLVKTRAFHRKEFFLPLLTKIFAVPGIGYYRGGATVFGPVVRNEAAAK